MKKLMVVLACALVAVLSVNVQPAVAGDDNPVFKSVRTAWLNITSADTANRFKINGTAVTATADQLNVTADADITDLADGSLTGSKVGTGIAAGNVTTGNLPANVMTNFLATVTGVKLTNTCVAADGKTNTYVFVPVAGGRYMLDSISTSP